MMMMMMMIMIVAQASPLPAFASPAVAVDDPQSRFSTLVMRRIIPTFPRRLLSLSPAVDVDAALCCS
jgi:hypothetical protein